MLFHIWLLGYDRGEDGNLVVNPEQAKVVQRIYGMFLTGVSPMRIAKTLTAEGIPTPGGKSKWNPGNIRNILTNEKYKDDALLQKTYTVDFLTKKKKSMRAKYSNIMYTTITRLLSTPKHSTWFKH